MDDDTHNQAAEQLRAVLPLMFKHGVPATPRNYAIWYEYVVGASEQLREVVDAAVAAGLPDGSLDEIYREHIATLELRVPEQVREAFRKLLSAAGEALSIGSSAFARFNDILGSTSGRPLRTVNKRELRAVVRNLTEETQNVQAHGDTLRRKLHQTQGEVEALREELEHTRKAARIDPLTGLANRACFDWQIRELAAAHASGSPPFGLILLDIDRFKTINDRYGHLVGDQVIRFVARTLVDSVKGKDLAARYGGEEFAVLLPETRLHGCVGVAERIRLAIQNTRLVKNGSREPLGVITASAGVAEHRVAEPVDDLIERADQALYRSKQTGRNRVTSEKALLTRPAARAP